MQFWKWALRRLQNRADFRSTKGTTRHRLAGFEAVEQRRLMTADPIQGGAVYIEQDVGSDAHGDLFQLTFRGGAPDTQLRRVVIDGDQHIRGFGVGDVFFDTAPTGLGVEESFPFTLTDDTGLDEVRATVTDGQTRLELEFVGFDAGESLTFTIDVDEVEAFDPAESDLTIINDGFDPITSGVEFQGTLLEMEFVAADFFDVTTSGTFVNRYDSQLTASGLPLPPDDFQGRRDRSAGAFVTATQTFIPASIQGSVYHDRNDNGRREAGEEGIAGVTIRIEPLETVIDQPAVTTTTDAEGRYAVAGLVAGRYQVIEISNPPNYLDGQDSAGTVAGQRRGNALNDRIDDIRLRGGDDGIEYNFGELRAITIRGRVQLSTREGDCFGSAEEHAPVAGARVQLQDAHGQLLQETTSDGNGYYQFSGMRPGTYRLVELTPDHLIDGGSHIGQVQGRESGRLLPGGTIADLVVGSGQIARNYDFCEHLPATLSGFVFHDRDDDGRREAGEEAIGETTLRLLDEHGQEVARTMTDAKGAYRFERLRAGQYTIVEQQPVGWTDGLDAAGTVASLVQGVAVNPGDRIETIELLWGDAGREYNFGEIKLSTLRGRVQFATRDGDCFGSSTEHEPVVGAAVQLWHNGRVIAETSSNADGEYLFAGLRPGQYRIVEITPPGLIQGGARAGTVQETPRGRVLEDGSITDIEILSDQQGIDFDFCEHRPAALSGYVYHDREQDGIRVRGDQGIQHVTVRLIDSQGVEVARTSTDDVGYYHFNGLSAGTYTVVEVHPTAWQDGIDSVGTVGDVSVGRATNPGDRISNIELRWGDEGIDYNFGEFRWAELSGRVQLSTRDGDCFDDSVEHAPVADAMVQLWDSSGRLVAETRTAADGQYRFSRIAPGTYEIVEITPAGLLDGDAHRGVIDGRSMGTITDAGAISRIRLLSANVGTQFDFCEHTPASIAGFVYHDREQDGIRVPSDQGIPHVTMRLIDHQGVEIARTTTDRVGYYRFSGLSAGTYSVVQAQPEAWQDGIDSAGTVLGTEVGRATNPGDRISDIELRWGDDGIDYNFGEFQWAELSGRVQQTTRDGDCFGDSEDHPPVAGALVQLWDQSGRLVAETRSAADGQYRFHRLAPGTYRIVEITPAGLLDGDARPGIIDGRTSGLVTDGGVISRIRLLSADVGTRFDFCEHPPATIAGFVYHDRDNNGHRQTGEEGIAGVFVELRDHQGTLVARSVTGSRGAYEFRGVVAGNYTLSESQPNGWLDGSDSPGLILGRPTGVAEENGDRISNIDVGWGDEGTEFNFGELLAGRLAGRVHADVQIIDCRFEPSRGDRALSGVTIELLAATGQVVARTQTDASGQYAFAGLGPGQYELRQLQPADYFDGAARPGSHGGEARVPNRITGIDIGSGQQLTSYNFCEITPVTLSGFVFQDGPAVELEADEQLPERIRDVRDGQLSSDDRPLAGVVVELRNGINGLPAPSSQALAGIYPPGPLRLQTDANGFYQFAGLRPGTYAVYEIQPDGYVDGVDTPGTAAGIAFNPGETQNESALQQLQVPPKNDAIVRISLPPGQSARDNNFSEVRVTQRPPLIVPPPIDPAPLPPPTRPTPPGEPDLRLVDPQLLNYQFVNYGHVIGDTALTWHLSVVDGGTPRGSGLTRRGIDVVRFAAESHPEPSVDMAQGVWEIPSSYGHLGVATGSICLGTPGGIPVVGDFNGDGYDEIGVYHEGIWYLDANANGRWDEGDLWARLGDDNDLPVTGDWNGDGKDDIGIFGREWSRDRVAMDHEPGLPDQQNRVRGRTKNVPPAPEVATDGHRLVRPHRAAPVRADVIDHVFRFGRKGDHPIVGDWNGDGIATIGVFRRGTWFLDVDGDGHWSRVDRTVEWGHAGDQPIVGDFDGDGIDDLAFFRDGYLYLDKNHNGKLDGTDERIAVGRPGDVVIAGDFNGDGVDEVAIYRVANEPDRVAIGHRHAS